MGALILLIATLWAIFGGVYIIRSFRKEKGHA
jgi:hypothetical protein